MKTLIVSEKNIAARRIAQLLASGKVDKGKTGNVDIYKFKYNGGDAVSIGLKGHILKVDFPDKYSNWQEVEPVTLIDAELIKVPTQKTLVTALKKQAKDADEAIIATDFDREGELIGADAARTIMEVNPDIDMKRARFSALTKGEITEAFSNLDTILENLARAGEARQDIDLIWGATLTRFISLASTRLGRQFLSVGRVQSPTLALVVGREFERRAFVVQTYWQLHGVFSHEGGTFEAGHKTEKFWEKDEVDKAVSNLGEDGVVSTVKRTAHTKKPPAPFNTTGFLTAASSIGVSPANAMRIAEGLYMSGYVSYPRVDNTVFPPSLDLRDILSNLSNLPELGPLADEINAQETLTPTRGKKQATDHPPIHPTGALPTGLEGTDSRIYEMIVRRFLATLASPSKSESMRRDIDVKGEPCFARGSRITEDGWLRYYHYSKKKDEILPALNEGDPLKLTEPTVDEKETQPPGRYSQGSLIQEMEKLGLGTKATRHNIIQNLYSRGYMHSDPIVPTDMGIAVSNALKKYAEAISSPEMTAELEGDMDGISDGKKTRDEVVDRSRKMLTKVMDDLVANVEEVGAEIRSGIQEGRTVGTCPACGEQLRIIRAKKSKKRFVGCSNYPDCKKAFPLPQYGDVISLGTVCDDCGSPKIKVVSKGRRPWELCLDPDCPTKEAYKKKTKKG